MSSSKNSPLDQTGKETRLVLETLLQVVTGAQIVAVVTEDGEPVLGLDLQPLVAGESADAFTAISGRVGEQLTGSSPLGGFSMIINGVEWGVLVDGIRIQNRSVAIPAALVVARHGRAFSNRERSLTGAVSTMFGHVATFAQRDDEMSSQRSLDELVTEVAKQLMSANFDNRDEVLNWVCETLANFLEADVAFIRRNDLKRELSILVSEFPVRLNKPDPDPLGEVPFDLDPIFMTTRDLREPYLTAGEDITEDYRDRSKKAAGVTPAAGAAVPLLITRDEVVSTWGVIGFIHFKLHDWTPAEVNALQAVASMIVQLQARIDAESETAHQAVTDELTGMPNRRALVQELKKRLQAKRQFAVMVIDLDRFKVMNDELGHLSGDKLITTIADRIQTSVRKNDFAARLGGGEFVCIIDKSDMLGATAQRILDMIRQPVIVLGQEVRHTASIGIAVAETGETDGLNLLSQADIAMYSAKAKGRDRYETFDDELRTMVSERSQIELQLRDAIDHGGLRLHFQPEIDLSTGNVLAAEALVRWQHPTRGLIAAGEFIDVAEETGLVTDLGRWVFNEACRQLAIWQKQFRDLTFKVRINMSPADFRAPDLVPFVEDCLLAHDVSGHRLCIEITEWTLANSAEHMEKILLGFKKLGIDVALDDFLTKSSNIETMKLLPVDMLKLDMQFVRGITTDDSDLAIVKFIIGLGKALNYGVIAEGIETPDIAEKLLELGCFRGQGYLMSRPVAAAQLDQMLSVGSIPVSVMRSVNVATPELQDLPS